MSKSIKCKNCKHIVSYDEDEEIWWHKHPHHNDNCECKKPEPNLKPIQKEILKELDKICYDAREIPHDYSRGWNSISTEDKFRSFTI
jgi:hypothetical protein